MKKIFMIMMMALMSIITVNAQEQTNYAGSSKFTDNWSVTLQGGILTTFDNFFSGHTATAPIVVLGADKFVNPWLGFGIEGRTLIGTGHSVYNTYTAFDAVNVSGYAKVNVLNAIKYNGERRLFEPVVYTGLGWGHQTASYGANHANYMTWRSGVELNFNLGKQKAWAVVVNPSVVWGNPSTTEWSTKINKHNGHFEVTAGIVYHFKNSNGKHSISKARLYDAAEVAALTARIAELENAAPKTDAVAQVVEKVVEKTVNVPVKSDYVVLFAQNSDVLTTEAHQVLESIAEGTTVEVVAYASPEGSDAYNKALSQRRADAVKSALESHGVKVVSANGLGVNGKTSNRVAIVTVK